MALMSNSVACRLGAEQLTVLLWPRPLDTDQRGVRSQITSVSGEIEVFTDQTGQAVVWPRAWAV